ncbi:hypothetical protein MACH16_13020 [Marinomonas pontica]|uniref:Uncharacterized protein n=1 Tax=Marinomonas pontica TaxID=264739 RepID=A0ABM8FEU0_9GAMM|nr:hypothetical protein MACH16_13020 [Marinomonas pontica]
MFCVNFYHGFYELERDGRWCSGENGGEGHMVFVRNGRRYHVWVTILSQGNEFEGFGIDPV